MATQQPVELNETAIEQMSKFERPIPGQSLTSDPDNPKAWEQPPEHTSIRTAIPDIFSFLIQEENFINLVMALDKRVAVADLAAMILFTGFQEGKWNPDLLLLLLEPTMYMIMAMAEKSEMGDNYVLYRGEEEDDVDPEKELKTLRNMGALENFKLDQISAQSVPTEIREKIENLNIPEKLESLLQKTEELPEEEEEQEEQEPTESLLAR